MTTSETSYNDQFYDNKQPLHTYILQKVVTKIVLQASTNGPLATDFTATTGNHLHSLGWFLGLCDWGLTWNKMG